MQQKIDIVCAGELLIDMISVQFAEDLEQAEQFKRVLGGSPANLGMNMARLGKKVQLVASVGQDDMGTYLLNNVKKVGISLATIQRVPRPTTLILVTRSKNVSNFEAYRGADAQILAKQFPDAILTNTHLFHTTCFGLSQLPAQTNIMAAAKKAYEAGAQLSIDLNYAQKIWKEKKIAHQLIADYCSHKAIVKISEVDWKRLYDKPFEAPQTVGSHFLKMGAKAVCLTLGGDGVWIFSEKESHFLPARSVQVKDTTGAGDAFWSGFLTAWLEQHTLLNCAKAGRNMAEYKIQRFGSLEQQISTDILFV